jgi:hypothetical protein
MISLITNSFSRNTTYTAEVKAAVVAGEQFEGKNATDYLSLLNHQNASFSGT